MSANIQVFDQIPPGWKLAPGATTAPLRYEFINNGKSRFSKEYQCGLVKSETSAPKAPEVVLTPVSIPKETLSIPPKAEKQSGVCFSDDPELPERLNRFAREETKLRLLRDIAADITVCQLGGMPLEVRERIEHPRKTERKRLRHHPAGILQPDRPMEVLV